LGRFIEGLHRDLVAVEGPGGTGIGLNLDEGLDNLSGVTPLLSAMRNWPRRGSRVPRVAAIVTEMRARVRTSRMSVRGHASPNVCTVARRLKSAPLAGSPAPGSSNLSSRAPSNRCAVSSAAL
jgi:hypothetical protein